MKNYHLSLIKCEFPNNSKDDDDEEEVDEGVRRGIKIMIY